MTVNFNFHEKTLMLTGAGGQIGKAIARRFVEAGGNVVLADVQRPDAFAAEFDASGERTCAVQVDVTSLDDALAAAQLVKERFGGIDVVVPAAGIYEAATVKEMGAISWRKMIDVNLGGVFNICRACIPLLKSRGAIVAVASIAAHRGSFAHAHYAAAKGGVVSFVRSLALELAPNIRVNAVSPGIIDTPLVTELLKTSGQQILASTPLIRLGQPDEVALATLFLASEAASFITGEVLHVNGGFYMD
jgi:3-oxoacyl-[acyl-carrier protein] reductase